MNVYTKRQLDKLTECFKEKFHHATLGKYCGLIVVKAYKENDECLASLAFRKMAYQNLYFLKEEWTILNIERPVVDSLLSEV